VHPPLPSSHARLLEGVRGFLAHKKHPPVGPYSSPMPRDLWWS